MLESFPTLSSKDRVKSRIKRISSFEKSISKNCQEKSEVQSIFKIMFFTKIVNDFQPLTIFTKNSNLDVCLASEYASEFLICTWKVFQFFVSGVFTIWIHTICPHSEIRSNLFVRINKKPETYITRSWRSSLSYRNQSIGLGWFLYDKDLHHERVKTLPNNYDGQY